MAHDLVVIGDVNPDLVVGGADLRVEFGQRETLADHAALLLGGSSSITACAAARLGLDVAFVGLVGADHAGGFCVDAMRDVGVDVRGITVDAAVSTGITVVLERSADRAIVTHPGSIASLAMRHVDLDLVNAARHVHVGSWFLLDGLRADLPGILAAARARGATTSLDTNDDPRRMWELDSVLDHCDVLLPNDHEACQFAGCTSAADAARSLAERVGTVAVTVGRAGALACQGAQLVEVAAAPVDPASIADAVGAGDTFDAGFLYGFLHGWDLEACLRAGVGAAALSLRGHGGTATLGSIDEAMALSGGRS